MKYRYVVKVLETVEYTTAVESDVKMTESEIEDVAECRRVEGGLCFSGVTGVDTEVIGTFADGKEVGYNDAVKGYEEDDDE